MHDGCRLFTESESLDDSHELDWSIDRNWFESSAINNYIRINLLCLRSCCSIDGKKLKCHII